MKFCLWQWFKCLYCTFSLHFQFFYYSHIFLVFSVLFVWSLIFFVFSVVLVWSPVSICNTDDTAALLQRVSKCICLYLHIHNKQKTNTPPLHPPPPNSPGRKNQDLACKWEATFKGLDYNICAPAKNLVTF